MVRAKVANTLTWAVANNYIGRKKGGLISVMVNVETKEVIPIPRNVEHVDFTSALLGMERDDLRNDPSRAARWIPSNIEVLGDEVIGVITGVSGLELGFRVRHTRADLQAAHDRVIQWVLEGELYVVEPLEKSEIVYRFASD